MTEPVALLLLLVLLVFLADYWLFPRQAVPPLQRQGPVLELAHRVLAAVPTMWWEGVSHQAGQQVPGPWPVAAYAARCSTAIIRALRGLIACRV
ncbi:MAG: hypothetical protein WKF73_09830 [Nocardioidaceae bacterium]